MASGRLIELQDFSKRPSVQNRSNTFPALVPYSTDAAVSETPLITPSDDEEGKSPQRDRAGDIISAQIHHALTGDASHVSQSPSYASSLASSLSTSTGSANLPSESREELFRKCLGSSTIDVDELRRIIWMHGTPDASWARPLAWKLLAGYLPPDRMDWEPELAAKRARYWKTVHDVTIDPSEHSLEGDHPLNDSANSQWRTYFADTQSRELIQKDVLRTYPDLHRFQPLREHLERILFVYTKQNPTLGYRQGMNELAAPLLLVFSDVRGSDLSDVEADAYFCFLNIMQEMGPCFAQDQVESERVGIGRQLRELQALLRIKDPTLENHFDNLKVDMRFYGLRWIRLWLSREFSLPDCLSLWDSLLTAEVRLPWIKYICVAMALRIRDQLLESDFVGCMKLLLNYPSCDIPELLRIADRLRTSNVVIVRTARR